jgi:hypothetical protein
VVEDEDTLSIEPSDERKFALSSALLSLNVNSLFDILIYREIQIEGLDLIKPSFKIVNNQGNTESDTEEVNSSKVFNLIIRYLNDFKIKELNVRNAQIDYTNILKDTVLHVKLSDVSLELNQFEISNPLDENAQIVRSSHFEFEILNDSIDFTHDHLITFDKIRGSSTDSIIRIEGFRIIPGKTDNRAGSLSVYLPYLELTDFDPRDIIYLDTLRTGEFIVGDGTIRLVLPDSIQKKDTPANPNIPLIFLGGINTRDLDLNIAFPVQGKRHNINFKGLNLNTSTLTFGGGSTVSIKKLIRDLELEVSIDEYTVDFTSLNHKASLKNVKLNVETGYFSADSVNVAPTSNMDSQYRSTTRNIQMWGLNLKEALLNDNLNARKILINNLDLDVVTNEEMNYENEGIDVKNIYPLVRNIFHSIKIHDFQINESNISYRNIKNGAEVGVENFSIRLDSIRIDSLLTLNPRQLLGARDIVIKGDGLNLTLNSGINEILSGPFKLNTISKEVQLDHIYYTSQYPTLRKFGSERIHASGINWLSLIHSSHLLLDSLIVQNPIVIVDKLDTVYIPSHSLINRSSPQFIDSLNIKYISVKEGKLDIRDFNDTRILAEGFSSNIEDIKVVRKNDKLFWHSYQFYAQNGPFSIAINEGNHMVSGTGMAISKYDSTLRLNQLKITPIKKSEKGSQADILVPNVIVTGINLIHLLDSSLIITDRTILINPTVNILSSNEDMQRQYKIQNESDNDDSGLRFFSNEVSLVNASLNLNYGQSGADQIKTELLDIKVNNLRIIPEIEIDSDLHFFDDIELEAKGITHSRLPMIDTIYVGHLELNSNSNIGAYDIIASGNNDQLSYSVQIPEIRFSSRSWLKKILNNDYSIDSLLISRPEIKMNLNDLSSEKPEKKDTKPPNLSISDFKVESGSMELTYKNNNYSIPNFQLGIELFDLTGEPEDLYSRNLSFQASDLNNLLPESYSTVDIKKIDLSTGNKTLQIQGLEVEPKFSKQEYGKERGFQTDWMNLKTSNISLTGFDYHSLIKDGAYYINEVVLDSIDLTVYRDKNIPFPEDQVRYMPQKMVADLTMPITIEAIIIKNANIRYEELVEGAPNAGYIELLNLTAGISNLSNDSTRLAKNPIMQIGSNSDLMGMGNLQADFEFDMTDPNGKHSYRAYLSKMPITELNKMLEPNVNMHIKSGQVTEMKMQVEGNSDYSIGSMRFLYEDLHFNLVGRKSGSTSKMGLAMGSFFANTFIVNRNNPKLLLVRNGDIYFERDTTKSILNYITKATLSGVVSSIGARNNRKYIKKANKESKDTLEKRKKKERINRKPDVTSKED